MEAMDKEEYLAWRGSDSTKRWFHLVGQRLEFLKQAWARGQFREQMDSEHALGCADQLDQLLNEEWEEYDELSREGK